MKIIRYEDSQGSIHSAAQRLDGSLRAFALEHQADRKIGDRKMLSLWRIFLSYIFLS
jgi:hypothetical protein